MNTSLVRYFQCALALGAVSLVTACSSTPTAGSSTSPTTAPTTDAASVAPAAVSDVPIATPMATVHVAGLACPKCASNVDLQLTKIPGLRVLNIDMGRGDVLVSFTEGTHPSSAQLARAVTDSGLTYRGVSPTTIARREE